MKIRINDRPDIQEIEVIINCVADDPLVNKIISALNTVDAKLLCRRQGETFQLGLADILYIESVDRKTFLYTEEQVYETDRRLYELEDYLKDHSFFRTSKTTIINLRRTKSIRPEIGARLLLTMDNQEKIIVSRQYAGSPLITEQSAGRRQKKKSRRNADIISCAQEAAARFSEPPLLLLPTK